MWVRLRLKVGLLCSQHTRLVRMRSFIMAPRHGSGYTAHRWEPLLTRDSTKQQVRNCVGEAGFAARGGCVGVASSLCLPCLITAVAATLLRVDSAASLSPSLTHRSLAPCATASHVSPPPPSLSLSRLTYTQERPCLTSHGPRLPPLPQPCLPPPKWVQQTHRRTLRQSVQDRRQSQHGPRYHGHQVIAVLSLQRCSFQ